MNSGSTIRDSSGICKAISMLPLTQAFASRQTLTGRAAVIPNLEIRRELQLANAGGDLVRLEQPVTSGWSLSGITRLSSGLPVTMFNNTDTSLLGTIPNGINSDGMDTPNYVPGELAVATAGMRSTRRG